MAVVGSGAMSQWGLEAVPPSPRKSLDVREQGESGEKREGKVGRS